MDIFYADSICFFRIGIYSLEMAVIHNIIMTIYHKNAFSLLIDDKIIKESGIGRKKLLLEIQK